MGACCTEWDEPTIHTETWPKARKQHKCCECGSDIKAGDNYERVTQLYNGVWSTYKTCEPCADLRESLSEVDCIYYMGLSECFTEWLTDGTNTVISVKAGSHAAKLVPNYFIDG